ncbi:hypothetical protein D052_4686 [Vibrio parahaemolyticus 10290]|nr:hypothetical protein D052_4686 [Vibrio parahaemolyticus 10290]
METSDWPRLPWCAYHLFNIFYDNVLLMQQGAFFKMGLNILLNVVLSISAAWIGFQLLMRS